MKRITKIAGGIAAGLAVLVTLDVATDEPEPSPYVAQLERDVTALVDETVAENTGTPGQENAVQAAENYIGSMPFSKTGLAEQLRFEGYSQGEVNYALRNMSPVDWREQAARAALHYDESMPFSKSGLYDQLVFEGYTPSQAQYGVNQVF